VQLRELLTKQGKWLFRWRSFLPILVILLVVPALRDPAFRGHEDGFGFEEVWEIICVGVACFGLAVRGYTIGQVPAGTSGRNTRDQRADALNTTGIYSVVRHPLYVGNFFIWLGVSMFVRSWWLSLVFILLFALFYERVIFTEEEFLREKFGKAWEDWAARTPTFIPRFKNYVKAALPFSLRNAVAKEYHVVINVILAFAVIEILEGLVTERKFELDVGWAVAVGCGLAAWVVIRVLKKKTGILRVEGR
jgi:protein-S-isoprenylcysteine O-methyltransferase Ste14